MSDKKLRVGWFSFSCCEDSTIVFTELLNEHWQNWKRRIDFRHARVLKSNNILDELDVAFVEGAITSAEQAKYLKEIRAKSAMVVAIGACAVIGLPSAQRNTFDKERLAEIEPLLARFKYSKKVQTPKELVKVDAEVPGCPMDPKKFLATVDLAFKKFNIPA